MPGGLELKTCVIGTFFGPSAPRNQPGHHHREVGEPDAEHTVSVEIDPRPDHSASLAKSATMLAADFH